MPEYGAKAVLRSSCTALSLLVAPWLQFDYHSTIAEKAMEEVMRRFAFAAMSFFILQFTTAQDRGLEVALKSLSCSEVEVGRQYALFIAIGRYKEWTPLRNAVSNARAIRVTLGKRYFVDELIELYDEKAIAVGIRSLFEQLAERMGPDWPPAR